MKICNTFFSPFHYYFLSLKSNNYLSIPGSPKTHNTATSLILWRCRTDTLRHRVEGSISRQWNIRNVCVPCSCIAKIFPLQKQNKKHQPIRKAVTYITLIFTNMLLYFIYILVKQHDNGRKSDRNLQVNKNII